LYLNGSNFTKKVIETHTLVFQILS